MSLREYKQYIDAIMPDLHLSVEDKDKNTASMIMYHFLRLQKMFKYEGLPDTIPARWLEFYLMCNGHCAVIHHEGNLYALKGGFGGDPDPYYVPQDYIIANPYLNLSKTYKRGVDCVVLGNDAMYYGLFPLVSKYCGSMAENELSMQISTINSRIISLITAHTDDEFESAKKFINDIKEGKLSAVASAPFFDGIRTQPYATSSQANSLTNLIEYEQYLKASLFNELGLNANYNMKRESINSNESQLNDDMLTPLIDEMLQCRKEGVEQVNEMFGTDITVDFASAWKENEVTTMIELEGLQDGEGADNSDSGVNTVDPGDSDLLEDVSTGVKDEPEAAEPAEEAIKEAAEDIIEKVEELLEDPEDEEVKEDV